MFIVIAENCIDRLSLCSWDRAWPDDGPARRGNRIVCDEQAGIRPRCRAVQFLLPNSEFRLLIARGPSRRMRVFGPSRLQKWSSWAMCRACFSVGVDG